MTVYTVILPLLIHVSSGATGWSEWSDCDAGECAWGRQFRQVLFNVFLSLKIH